MAKIIKSIDLLLLLPAILLSSLGLLLIYSTSYETDPSFFARQAIYIVFSIIIFFVISRFDFKTISHISPLLYVFVIFLLLATFFVGASVRGSMRWIDLGFITVQGSELSKPILVLTLASFFARFSPSNFKNLTVSVGLLILPLVFILRQPDLSNSLILLSGWLFMVFMAGVNLLYLLTVVIILAASAPLIWGYLLKGYQKARILSFFNPTIDPQGASYNVVQALIALGSGQVMGKGLGRGTQSHLDFLPEGRTDFIFSVAGEELGFIGLGLIILIFTFLVYRILKIAAGCRSAESGLFTYGAAFIIGVQFFINAAMNMGIFPVSGVTLPFVSFGGSSMVSMFVLLGLVQAVENSLEKH
ncbi:MAG TPA: rod shape-determining protein RodA [Candidatus Nanoarchaeia archaeon]